MRTRALYLAGALVVALILAGAALFFGVQARGDRLVQPGHLAGRVAWRTADSTGVADPDHLVTEGDLGRVAGLGNLEPGGVLQLEDGDVVRVVVPDHAGLIRLPVPDIRHADLGGTLDHVVIGEDLTGRGQHDPGPGGASAFVPEHGVHVHQTGRELRRHG